VNPPRKIERLITTRGENVKRSALGGGEEGETIPLAEKEALKSCASG